MRLKACHSLMSKLLSWTSVTQLIKYWVKMVKLMKTRLPNGWLIIWIKDKELRLLGCMLSVWVIVVFGSFLTLLINLWRNLCNFRTSQLHRSNWPTTTTTNQNKQTRNKNAQKIPQHPSQPQNKNNKSTRTSNGIDN